MTTHVEKKSPVNILLEAQRKAEREASEIIKMEFQKKAKKLEEIPAMLVATGAIELSLEQINAAFVHAVELARRPTTGQKRGPKPKIKSETHANAGGRNE